MIHWIKNHKILTLVISLIILSGLNIWLFGSNFITQKQLLTAEQLNEFNQELADVSEQASKLAGRQASKPLTREQLLQSLQPLQKQTDQIILRLKTADYPKEYDGNVEESLQLAEILSFTLHNYELQPQNALSSANISQVLHQTSINAANLPTIASAEH